MTELQEDRVREDTEKWARWKTKSVEILWSLLRFYMLLGQSVQHVPSLHVHLCIVYNNIGYWRLIQLYYSDFEWVLINFVLLKWHPMLVTKTMVRWPVQPRLTILPGGGTSSAATDRCSIRGPEKQGRQKLCPHCLDVVSRATYYRHKRTFYDHQTKEWKSKSHTQPSSSVGEVGGDCTTPIDDGRRGISLHVSQPYRIIILVLLLLI